jgi:hypothetical protein
MKKYLVLSVLSLIFTIAARAGNTTTSGWLLINNYPEFAAKGSATGAASHGITAAGINPAAIAEIDNVEFAVMRSQWVMDMSSQRLSAGKAFDFGNIGFELSYADLGTVGVLAADESGNPVITGDTASMRAWGGSLVYAKKIKSFSFGLAGKMFSENLSDGDYYFGCADAGVIYEGFINDRVNLGISMLNISAGNNGYFTPIDLNAAVLFKYEHGGSPVIYVSAACDYLVKDSYITGMAGFDYFLFDTVIIRGGININQTGDLSFSAGAGVKVEGLNIGYSYEPVPGLGASHRISINAALGKSPEAASGEGEGDAIAEKGTFANYLESGNYYYDAKEYRKAIKYYEYINTLYWKDLEDKPAKEKSSFYQKIGICYYNIRDSKRALLYFDRALYFDKENEILKHWIKSLK